MTSEDRYHQLLELSPGAIVVVDRDGQVADCNRAACSALGRSRREVLGTPVLRWIAAEERNRCKAHFLQAFQGGVVEWRSRIERGDGTIRALQFRAGLIGSDAETRTLHVFLREAEEARPGRPDVAQLQAVLLNLPDQFVAVVDTGGRLRFCSGVARVLWYDDDDSVGREFASLVAPGNENRALMEEMLREMVHGLQWEGTLWLARADGSPLPVRAFAVPYRDPRTEVIAGTLLVARDTSAEHEAREALARAERLRPIGELVVSIAKELRAPLGRIAAALPAGAGGDRDAARPAEEAERLVRLLDALMGFARGVRVERSESRLEELIEEVVAEEAPRLEVAGIELVRSVSDALPPLLIDAAQVGTVLRALIANAREALAGRKGRLQIAAAPTETGIALSVRDDGPGFPANCAERIFEPFFTTKASHLGLDLAVAQGIVTAHGGRIWAERAPGGWTVFSVELPARLTLSNLAFRPVPLVLCRARSVLVVDDDAAVRAMIRRLLEKVGHEVTEAWSGRSALAQLTSGEPPDLVVTDLKMTDGTGFWFIDQLAKDFPGVLRRTVIITGDPSSTAVEKLSRETGCPVVRKPFEFRTLLEALDEAALRG